MWIFISVLLFIACIALFARWRRDVQNAGSVSRNLRAELETLRQGQEQALLQTRAHQLAIFNSMVEGILILDERGRVLTTNTSLERLFNLAGDVRGKTVMEAFRSHDLLEITDRARTDGVVRAYELRLPGIHHTRYIEVNAAAIHNSHDHLSRGLILIFHDFTRIKELESVRKEFVANVSHELRTPLTLIKGYVETLIDGAKDDPDVSTRFLQTIHKHTNRLAFLIEDLLTISHLESGQIILQREVMPLHSIIEWVLDELQSPAAQRSVTLQNLVSPDLHVNADGDRLEQVLHNLVDNAIKYGRVGGNITVSAERLPDAVTIKVRDDGPGIPPEARERIFERFFRVDRARSRDQGGTGLGLAIVKHIVQSHGGKVWVESEMGQGSIFYFTIPDASADALPAPESPGE